MSSYPRVASLAIIALLFAVNLYRAATQSITHDEALTYETFVAQSWDAVFHTYDANHHVLHTILCKLSTGLFGLSEFALRLPSLLGGLLFLYVAFCFGEELFGKSWIQPLAVAVLCLNPYLLDFLSAARGYGMAIGFFFLALYLLWRYVSGRRGNWILVKAGAALGLSVAANLTLLFPCLSLLAIFAALAIRKVKDTKSSTIVWLLVPFVVIDWILLFDPLSQATRGNFYVGSLSVGEAVLSLVQPSFSLFTAAVVLQVIAWVLLPFVFAMLAFLAYHVIRRWETATVGAMILALSATTMVLTFALLIAAFLLFDVPLPAGRTGLYWIPLFTLACLAAVATKPRVLIVFASLLVLVYLAELRTNYYADWGYDRHSNQLIAAIAQRNRTHSPVTIGGSWQYEPSLNFYREKLRYTWMKEVERGAPDGAFDFYVLSVADLAVAERLHLDLIFRDSVTGAVVAVQKR